MLPPKKEKVKPRFTFKEKVKIVKSMIKSKLTPPSKESRDAQREWKKEQDALKAEFPDAFDKKRGGATKMQNGGSKTRKNVITGRTRVTTPYAVGAPSKGTVAPRDYATGTKTEVYSKKGDLAKTKYKYRGTGKYDTEGSKYPYNYVREEEKPGGVKKEKYPILPAYLQPADKLKKGGATKMKKGGAAKDDKWIQKAVNPKHKGYCTPMSKPTCTPKRKALARTFKAMAKNK